MVVPSTMRGWAPLAMGRGSVVVAAGTEPKDVAPTATRKEMSARFSTEMSLPLSAGSSEVQAAVSETARRSETRGARMGARKCNGWTSGGGAQGTREERGCERRFTG